MVCIELRMQIAAPIERCFDLSRRIEVHLLGTEQSGERAVGGVTAGLIGPRQFVRWRAKHLGVRQHLASKITASKRPSYFLQGTMIEGTFKFMQHDHYFSSLSADLTEMRDQFTFAAPLPILGSLAERWLLRHSMETFLQKRNEILNEIAESARWRQFLPRTERNVVSGGG
jgi:hypothetical protein